MSYSTCVKGGKLCDGCMACYEEYEDDDLDLDDEDYEYEDYEVDEDDE